MTKIDMAALLADREAGTDDPWEVIDGNTHGSEIIAPAQPSVRRNVAKCGGPNRESNARRIARLPELEAAYIEAVDALLVVRY